MATRSKTLVIDDDPIIRHFIARTLTKQGHEVLTAGDGNEGVDLMRSERPGLVLCDVRMEGLDGYKALEILRADPSTATVPFILMTGTPEAAGMRQGMKLGADDYLAKPFSVPELIAAVEAQERKRALLLKQEERRLKDLRTSLSLALPHEFFTPLNAILGFSEAMGSMADSITPGEIREMTSTISESGERLHRVIKRYMTYAQFELFFSDAAKIAELRLASCAAAESVIQEAAAQIAEKAGRRADLTLDLDPASLRISAAHLANLIEEVADNSFKFSKAGSPVRIEGRAAQDSYIIRLRDFGRGMSPEEISQAGAFLQFQRKKHEQQGMGLGLATARRIAEVHGGFLRIHGEATGVTASVDLPVAPPA